MYSQQHVKLTETEVFMTSNTIFTSLNKKKLLVLCKQKHEVSKILRDHEELPAACANQILTMAELIWKYLQTILSTLSPHFKQTHKDLVS